MNVISIQPRSQPRSVSCPLRDTQSSRRQAPCPSSSPQPRAENWPHLKFLWSVPTWTKVLTFACGSRNGFYVFLCTSLRLKLKKKFVLFKSCVFLFLVMQGQIILILMLKDRRSVFKKLTLRKVQKERTQLWRTSQAWSRRRTTWGERGTGSGTAFSYSTCPQGAAGRPKHAQGH